MHSHRIHLVAAAIALLASVAGAQDAQHSNARWQAFYGCWTAEPRDAETQPPARTVCLTPTSNPDVVEVSAIADGKIVHRDTIDASGRAVAIKDDGCEGTQRASWSADGRRVFLTSMTTCSGAVTKTSAVIAMTPHGEWLDIRSVETAGRTLVNVARYKDIGISPALSAEMISSIRGYAPNIEAARLASGVPIPPSAVIEASKAIDAAVLEAWVTQTGLTFVTDAAALQQLADAGISGEVTDAMVAVEANSRDVYDLWVGRTPFGRQASDYWDQGTGQRRVAVTTWVNDPWGYGIGNWRYGRQYNRYAFGTNDWSWLYGPSWGYNNNPFGMTSSAQTSPRSLLPPTMVLHNDGSNTAARGRSEKAEVTETEPPKRESILDKTVRSVTGGSSTTKQAGTAKP